MFKSATSATTYLLTIVFRHGFKALQTMLGTIRKCSKNESLDSLDALNPFYMDALRRIDSYLLRAIDSTGNWSDALIPTGDTEPSDFAVRNILFRRRSLTNSRKAAIQKAIKNGHSMATLDDADVVAAKEVGLNANTLFNFCLSDVDVNEVDFPSPGKKKEMVSKFLNRLLGLSLTAQRQCKSSAMFDRQQLISSSFLRHSFYSLQ